MYACAQRQPRRVPPPSRHTRPGALGCACLPAGKVAGEEGGGGLREERAPLSAGVHCGKEAAASRAGWRCSGGGGGKSSRPHTAVWSRGPSPASPARPSCPSRLRAPAPPPRAALRSRPVGPAPLPGPAGRPRCPDEAGRGGLDRPAAGRPCRTSALPPTAHGRARSPTWPSSGSRGTRPGERGGEAAGTSAHVRSRGLGWDGATRGREG